MKNIGKAFRLLRIQKGWEQTEFAKKLNLSNPAVSKIETEALPLLRSLA
ncbi:helix-turn-helix domain-containing protein [Sphingobacterium siyangense]|nr:helix-turn-helix transcriptional regulator [Sphingobacterium siyangense]